MSKREERERGRKGRKDGGREGRTEGEKEGRVKMYLNTDILMY